MTFADAGACLSCRAKIEPGVSTCPHCGVNLASHEIQQAWRALVVADQWVARARTGTAAAAPDLPTPPADRPGGEAAAQRPRLSAGTVLLVLGAASLLVAGLIFITVSWGSMGIVGRAMSLLGFTAIIGGIAHVVSRRALRASAEALWTVFLGLLTLDWFAARDQGLFGLEAVPGGFAAGIWGLVVLATGVAIVRAGRGQLGGRTLIAPAIAAGAAPVIGAAGVAGELIHDDVFWWAYATALTSAIAALAHRRLAVRPAELVSATGAAVLAVAAASAALVEAVDFPSLRQLTLERHGLPLLMVALTAAILALATSDRARAAGSMVSAVALATLVALAADHGLAVAALLTAALAAAAAGNTAWHRGWQWASGVGVVAVGIGTMPWLWRLVEVAGAGAFGPRSSALTHRISVDAGPALAPWWTPALVALALSGALLLARRWLPVWNGRGTDLRAAAVLVAGVGAAATIANPAPPAVSLGSSLALIGGLVAFANRRAPLAWTYVSSAVVLFAPVTTLSSWPASLIVWPLAAVVLAGLGWREREPGIRWAERGFAAWWICLVPGIAMEQFTGSSIAVAAAIVAAAGVLLISVAVRERGMDRAFGPVDAGAATSGLIGLLLGSVPHASSVPWTVAGAGVTIAGLINTRRRWCRWAGPALLGIAYVMRLSDSGVDVVEAYTAPFAVALLGAGVWAMRKPTIGPEIGTVRALLPGVVLALLPSVPQSLDHPTSLRAWLLGAVALAMLAVGLTRRWRVPFVGGAAVLLLLLLANIGPWALGLPRWVLFSGLGVVAIGIGATWESRVRDGRAAASYVGRMR